MHITIIGTGYVGLVAGACFADTGNDVTCADIDAAKIDLLNDGVLPIYEPGLDSLVASNVAAGRLRFTTDVDAAIASASVVFIAVGTPPDEDGSADLRHVLAVADGIGRAMRRETVVVTKSTVPVGTAAKVSAAIARHAQVPFHVCSNPEFLKEGAAIEDFMKPDRIVLGAETDYARSLMTEIYAPFVRSGRPIIFMDIASAEVTKYAANAMLATRISFMNEIAALCDAVGANVDHIRKGIGSDSRIGSAFLFPGPGYGGSCFPKDVAALVRTAGDRQVPMLVLDAVEAANARQKHVLGQKTAALLAAQGRSLAGARIAVWGLAFKAQTDDMRESPALTLIDDLLAAGATVVVHDPVAMHEAGRRLGTRVTFATSSYDAATDWNEDRHPDFERLKGLMRSPTVVDGRNLYDQTRMLRAGFQYTSIGRP
jgi:UDPglucose 6-dehydrogenase